MIRGILLLLADLAIRVEGIVFPTNGLPVVVSSNLSILNLAHSPMRVCQVLSFIA